MCVHCEWSLVHQVLRLIRGATWFLAMALRFMCEQKMEARTFFAHYTYFSPIITQQQLVTSSLYAILIVDKSKCIQHINGFSPHVSTFARCYPLFPYSSICYRFLLTLLHTIHFARMPNHYAFYVKIRNVWIELEQITNYMHTISQDWFITRENINICNLKNKQHTYRTNNHKVIRKQRENE